LRASSSYPCFYKTIPKEEKYKIINDKFKKNKYINDDVILNNRYVRLGDNYLSSERVLRIPNK
jgi:hypothetical protein